MNGGHNCPTGSESMARTGHEPPADALCIELGFVKCAARVLEVLPSSLILCDEAGIILYLNDEGGRVLGIAPSQAAGRNIAEILAPLERILETAPDPERDGRSKVIATGSRPGSRVFGVSITRIRGLVGTEEHEQHVIVFRDITGMEATRRERDRLLRMATIARLLPTVAHEIRNPLAGIQSLVELLLKGDRDAGTHEDLELILHEVERLRLIVQGLDFQAGTILEPATEVDLETEAHEVVRLVRDRFEQSQVGLELEVDTPLTGRLNGSVFRLVLLNLLNNALEACSPGEKVRIRLCRGAPGIVLEVADTGCGMDPAVLERVTDLFFSTKPRGSGIGLALVDRVVSSGGGRLWVESVAGQGTEVHVEIPQGEAET